ALMTDWATPARRAKSVCDKRALRRASRIIAPGVTDIAAILSRIVYGLAVRDAECRFRPQSVLRTTSSAEEPHARSKKEIPGHGLFRVIVAGPRTPMSPASVMGPPFRQCDGTTWRGSPASAG